MQFLQTLSTKAEAWTRKYGVVAKNLAKISLKTLIPSAGELLAEGIDCIFEIVEHQGDLKWKERLDQQLQVIQADQERYLQLLETIESCLGSLLSDISKEFQQSLSQVSNAQTAQITNAQEQQLKSLFDRSFSQHETQFIQLQESLLQSAQNFKTVDQKLDEIYRKQIEMTTDQKEGNQSLKEGLEALKLLYQQLSSEIQDKQQEHSRNQAFRDFLVEIEHEMLHHNLNRAKVILENAFIKKTIDLQFKQLYECKINSLQGHLSQIEDLLEKSKELSNLKGISNIKQQVKNAAKWIIPLEEYRNFLHQSGKMIGDKGWKLDVPIGIGGMGEVWKAHNLKGEIGAIKFVHEELLMDQFAKKKFFDEIDSLSKLQHPNIVALKDWGIENGTNQLYLVMAYVEGETLRQMINRKAYFSWHEAQGIFRDLVEALYHCHQLNVIHKDIKPDNIILHKNPKNQPILIDFGIAKIKKMSNQTKTKTGMVTGTELYMSPEQKSGGHLDGKADIYSLGVTLLESLTGKCAVDGKLLNLDDEILDLIDDCLATWRKRCYAEQLFEKLGGDLEKLKKRQNRGEEIEKEINQLKQEVQKAKNELMQANMNYQSLMNEKDAIENTLKQNRSLFEGKISEVEKSIQEKEKLIQNKEKSIQDKEKSIQQLRGENKQLGEELQKIKKQNQDQNIQLEDQKFRLKDQDKRIKTMLEEIDKLKKQYSNKVDPQTVKVVTTIPIKENSQHNSKNQSLVNSVGYLKKVIVKNATFNMVYCPKGEFRKESTKQKVKITNDFWMGETQVTQDLWVNVMGWNPSAFKGSLKLPVEKMTWYDCLQFCNRLSELENLKPCFNLTNIERNDHLIKKANVEWNRNANGYRLPTEAEWEYCAKAWTDFIYSGSDDVDDVAWYNLNSSGNPHEVKTKKANTWGLYDMSGNVWERCMDQWDEQSYVNRSYDIENPVSWNDYPCKRVARGGSCRLDKNDCRVDHRSSFDASSCYSVLGMRLFRSSE